MTHPNVPIIGQPSTYPAGVREEVNAEGLTSRIEIHDSEINEIHKVLEILRERGSSGRISYADFTTEVKDRFAAIGFIVAVNWYEAGTPDGAKIPGMLIPEIVIKDRTEAKAFDHDQQVHEVTNDVLGLGDGGVIKTRPEDFQRPEGHQH